jgi:hypothetical protein
MCTNRIVLSWQRGLRSVAVAERECGFAVANGWGRMRLCVVLLIAFRCATLAKSPTLPETTVNYDVTVRFLKLYARG